MAFMRTFIVLSKIGSDGSGLWKIRTGELPCLLKNTREESFARIFGLWTGLSTHLI